MAEKTSPVASYLKNMLKKLTVFVGLCRPSGQIRIVLEDQRRITENHSARKPGRASNSSYGNCKDDIDQRAEIFIDNFRRQLRLERQISLQLRYYGVNSPETEYEESSPPPPLPPSPSIE